MIVSPFKILYPLVFEYNGQNYMATLKHGKILSIHRSMPKTNSKQGHLVIIKKSQSLYKELHKTALNLIIK